mmetsp:Transcript_18160/g.37823  ORF Transcript_18160/g.37823 Transcript_18160/m.37823 type:complete len:131 (+) Transcript_18160:588-980(+)
MPSTSTLLPRPRGERGYFDIDDYIDLYDGENDDDDDDRDDVWEISETFFIEENPVEPPRVPQPTARWVARLFAQEEKLDVLYICWLHMPPPTMPCPNFQKPNFFASLKTEDSLVLIYCFGVHAGSSSRMW